MSETTPKIELDARGLGSILKQWFVKVPLDQRDYAWENENVTQLYDDFSRAISAGEEHFLGSLVTIPKGKNALEIVDGQQRLATTALLLAAIRGRLRELDEQALVVSVTGYLADIDRKSREEVPKLQLNVDDNDLFALLLKSGKPDPNITYKRDSHKYLIAAYKLALARVEAIVNPYATKDQGDVLNQWIDFIEHDAVAVLMRVPDDANAFRMFETLNDRGLKVSQADLVKNYLYKTAKDRKNEAQIRWSQMRSILDSLESDDLSLMLFLRHALIVMEGHIRDVDVFGKVQALAKTPQLVVTLAARLHEMANTYVATFNPEHEMWSDFPASARRAIEVLNLFQLKPMRPLLVAVSRQMMPKEAAASLEFLVSLGVRLIIASTTRSASVELPLSAAAKAVYDGTIPTYVELRDFLNGITPSDSRFRGAFATARVSSPKFARYYLRSLESNAQGTHDPWFIPESDPEKITLEHVLPRVPGDNWPSFDSESAADYVNRLGNLVLLTRKQNSDLKSDNFATKRPTLASSPYVLTEQVGREEDWTAESIDLRQAQMADRAIATWPVK